MSHRCPSASAGLKRCGVGSRPERCAPRWRPLRAGPAWGTQPLGRCWPGLGVSLETTYRWRRPSGRARPLVGGASSCSGAGRPCGGGHGWQEEPSGAVLGASLPVPGRPRRGARSVSPLRGERGRWRGRGACGRPVSAQAVLQLPRDVINMRYVPCRPEFGYVIYEEL